MSVREELWQMISDRMLGQKHDNLDRSSLIDTILSKYHVIPKINSELIDVSDNCILDVIKKRCKQRDCEDCTLKNIVIESEV